MKTYYDFAENDYLFLQDVDLTKPTAYNSYCALSQKICERYLKYLVDAYTRPTDIVAEKEKQDILRTHSLRKLYNHLKVHLPDFTVDSGILYGADSYYFSTQYPGDNAFFATIEDVNACKDAVDACRSAVKIFIDT